jgi:Uncharacterized protein conserved in bacteria
MSAVLSECGKYRYELERQIAPLLNDWHKPVVFIGVNPSTADADTDDATIRKMSGFTLRWGFTRFMVGNVFAYRSTDVTQLPARHDAVGPENMGHLHSMIQNAAFVVPCWGNTNKVPKSHRVQFTIVRTLLQVHQVPVRIFGLTNGGDPLHPLMLSYDTPLQEWSKL